VVVRRLAVVSRGQMTTDVGSFETAKSSKVRTRARVSTSIADTPALSGHPHQAGQRHAVRAVAAQVGQFPGAGGAADQQVMLTAVPVLGVFGQQLRRKSR
jgi:hypothetical protein